jgi:hypothetical protein
LRGEPLARNGFVSLYTDITAQRYIEGLIQQQNVLLEHGVMLRTAELEGATPSSPVPTSKTHGSPWHWARRRCGLSTTACPS